MSDADYVYLNYCDLFSYLEQATQGPIMQEELQCTTNTCVWVHHDTER